MSNLLSIIIPTKNRQKYCLEAIKQILSLSLSELQICIQDNSDNNILEKEIEELNSDCVVYNYHGGSLSFVDNFSEAVSLSTGEFVCMIGDDDGILSNIIEVTKKLKEKGIDAFIPGLNSVYFWPTHNPIYKGGEDGFLIIKHTDPNIKNISPQNSLLRLLQNGCLDYLSYDLPRLYHGIVKRDVLDEIKKNTGSYFGGLTPDIYMATSLSFVCKNVAIANIPVTISGICSTSGSADSATGKHTGKLSDAPHFRGHEVYEWEEKIPAFYSVETIWAESLIKAIRDFRKEYLLTQINFSRLYSFCNDKYPQYSTIISETARDNNVDIYNIKKTPKLVVVVKSYADRIINRIFNRIPRVFYNVIDIEAAAQYSMKYLKYTRLN